MRFLPLRRSLLARLGALLIALGAAPLAPAQVVVTWQAATTNGLGDSFGTPLPAGFSLQLGAFLVSNATIQANASNHSFLLSNFIVFDTTTIGTGVDGI